MNIALALGTIGWGLVATGTLGHLRHPEQLTEALRVHTTHARIAGRLLIGAELVITVVVAAALIADSTPLLAIAALAGAVLGLGFTAWVLRLLLSNSDLPCACSFSSAPTSGWSVVRAGAVVSIGLLALGSTATTAETLAALVVGAAMGLALFLVPDALAWPDESMRLREFASSEAPAS